ncbi:UDP-4-amino-4,6-dideoxy-N-acetyl-beta-L-altrosamine transaminase [Methylomonas rivi]|uniref:UDP-4-amino-4, 6-dideoxy-N-acetyl-beta-L-altrosamine transaminase n=1 Tax=Methylomonas rivi TaxID=2952226 RepID=A0ABT1U016_9GAMM|nr:UDP-4-amino-4,6-dideoxy-N-acetyl-beta-L-altrosamine transaminase [Methylomonas sp. WSC-6]MCQ8126933.1 UDP-4-amino-4,6-dideoxy-N-acetyl-beta-L-altrosamine transaminase [Methylomonas sp. WSC-6]
MIPYGRQQISDADIQAVVEVLKSDYLTQGPAVPAFENAVAAYCGAGHAVAVNSATSALHLACLALGVRAGDFVWTSPITFVASANCALYCGAEVDFVDIDPSTCNISVQALAEKLHRAEQSGRLPKVVIPVHLCGLPCDMAEIHRLSKRYGFRILEDASHAIGGKYRDQPIGNCRYSDISVFSFHPVKIITTGEGGMALTNDSLLAKRMTLLRSHGITREAAEMTHEADGPWYYQQIELGFNYRMTDLQAALGLSQLKRLDAFVARRHRLAGFYRQYLAGLPVVPQSQPDDCYSAFHLFVIRLQNSDCKMPHREVFCRLRDAGIGVNLHYIPVHLQPYYRQRGFKPGDFPQAERYYAEALTLPLYPDLSEAQQLHVIATLRASV